MRLNRKFEAVTGLSTASFHSEALQVIITPGCIKVNNRIGCLLEGSVPARYTNAKREGN